MGGLFKAIGDFFGSIVDAIWDAVCNIMDAVWKFISHNIIEPIMNFLGFEDETIIMTDVIATKVFDKSILPDTKIKAALKKQSEDISVLDYLGEFDAYDQVRIVNSFTDDEVKLSVLSSFSSNNQVTIIKTIEDLNVLDRAFAFVDSQWDRAAIIKTRTSDEDKLFLFKLFVFALHSNKT